MDKVITSIKRNYLPKKMKWFIQQKINNKLITPFNAFDNTLKQNLFIEFDKQNRKEVDVILKGIYKWQGDENYRTTALECWFHNYLDNEYDETVKQCFGNDLDFLREERKYVYMHLMNFYHEMQSGVELCFNDMVDDILDLFKNSVQVCKEKNDTNELLKTIDEIISYYNKLVDDMNINKDYGDDGETIVAFDRNIRSSMDWDSIIDLVNQFTEWFHKQHEIEIW